MEERLAHHHVPGVGVAVIDKGELAWAAGYGHIEEGKPGRVDGETMFSGASISKPVTAMLALQMIERGIWNLDVDVNRYLKSWQVPVNEFTKQHPVTLRLLLSHRAGTTIHGFGGTVPDGPLPVALDILTKKIPFRNGRTTNGVTVDKVPGGTVRYSGGGTTIVEQMLEDATGKRFHQLARENVFEPLAMTRTTFEAPLPERYHANAAIGHEDGATLPERYVCVIAIAAGAIFTTPADYARFMIGCRNAWHGKPKSILGRQLAQEMMTPQGGIFGIGWEIFGSGANRRFGHGGSNNGYQCESTCYLEKDQGAVVMTNADTGLFFYWEVFNAIADLYHWQDFMLPEKTVRTIPEDELPRYVGTYDIVSGVDAPEMRIWVENGKLKNEFTGMRGGPREIMMDQNGRFFHQMGPYETAITYDYKGFAQELTVLRGGTTETMRARRRKTA